MRINEARINNKKVTDARLNGDYVLDLEPPVITPLASNEFEIGVDVYTYPEPGTVVDNVDGSIPFTNVNMLWYKATEDGQKGESIEPFKWGTKLEDVEPGKYYIEYNIADKTGNRGYAHRIVTLYKRTISYIEYLENQEKEYIDTGIVGNQDSTIIVELMPNEVKAYIGIAGSRSSGYIFGLYTRQNVYRADYRNKNIASEIELDITKKVVLKLDKNKFYVNNNLIHQFDYLNFVTDQNIYLFTVNSNGIPFNSISYKLYSAKVYDNGVLVRDFKPCLDTNNVACLYDEVSKQYFYKQSN